MVQVLVGAPMVLTHLLLPRMHQRGYGRILNVASVAGLLPGPAGGALYGPSKALLIGFSESLHAEQRGSGVHVTALCPGFTRSEFHDVNGTRARFERLPKFLWLEAERVAREGYSAVMRNEALCVPGTVYRILTAAARLLPHDAARRIAARAGRFRNR
jgi:short-subunit dehydrogenase